MGKVIIIVTSRKFGTIVNDFISEGANNKSSHLLCGYGSEKHIAIVDREEHNRNSIEVSSAVLDICNEYKLSKIVICAHLGYSKEDAFSGYRVLPFSHSINCKTGGLLINISKGNMEFDQLWEILQIDSSERKAKEIKKLFLPLDIDVQTLEILYKKSKPEFFSLYLKEMFAGLNNNYFTGKLESAIRQFSQTGNIEMTDNSRIHSFMKNLDNLCNKDLGDISNSEIEGVLFNLKTDEGCEEINSFHEWYCSLNDCLTGGANIYTGKEDVLNLEEQQFEKKVLFICDDNDLKPELYNSIKRALKSLMNINVLLLTDEKNLKNHPETMFNLIYADKIEEISKWLWGRGNIRKTSTAPVIVFGTLDTSSVLKQERIFEDRCNIDHAYFEIPFSLINIINKIKIIEPVDVECNEMLHHEYSSLKRYIACKLDHDINSKKDSASEMLDEIEYYFKDNNFTGNELTRLQDMKNSLEVIQEEGFVGWRKKNLENIKILRKIFYEADNGKNIVC